MSDKRMSLQDFAEAGFLHEINRLVLHPCGLALALCRQVDDEGNVGAVVSPGFTVIDRRDDPEGFIFGNELDSDKVRRVAESWAERRRSTSSARARSGRI